MKKPIPDAVLKQHIAFIGKTGSGKTSTAKLAIEQVVAAGHRVCILDTIKSDWWGITSSANGKEDGLKFQILGGPRGHVPLHPTSGTVIGELVARGSLPLSIVDTSEFTGGQLNKFFIDFAAALWKQMQGVLYLVIEEAHELAPKERAGVGDENMALHWAKKLGTGARSKGLHLFVLTQRLQALHNAMLGSCDTMIVHRLTLPADQKPALDWLKANMDKATVDEVAASLSSLPTGTGWICSGEAQIHERVAFPKISTYDNSATPTSCSGEHRVKTAAVDLDKLRSILGDAVKEAEANDPKLLRKRIAELEKQLASKPAAVTKTDVKAVERAVQAAVAAEHKKNSALFTSMTRKIAQAGSLTRKIVELCQNADWSIPEITSDTYPSQPVAAQRVASQIPKTAPNYSTEHRQAAKSADGLSKAQQRIIDALAWYESLGNRNPSMSQIGAVALIDPTGGYFSNTVGPLTSGGLVTRGNGTMSLTDAGRAAANPLDDVGTLAEYHEVLKRRILKMKSANGKTIAILEVVINARGESLTVEQIGELVGIDHTGGYFSNSIGPLSTAGVIQRGNGVVTPTDVLFPEGLA